ncbi:MAG TPA: response regulator transcription factor [Micromonosporaceae bacterium]|nr:response regulator transcription factor [Micromonosporaceae bacterium]
MNVLLCDDHVVFADCLADLLTAQGLDVVAVTYDPHEAVRALLRVHVDVALLDVAFGERSLLDHLPAIRAASPSTRLVVLTGHLDEQIMSSCRAAGVAGFAEKRQSGNAITGTIERVAAGGTVLPVQPRRTGAAARPTAEVAAARRLAGYLTARERQVLGLLVTGCDTAGLARTLGVTRATARSHVQSTLIKLQVHSRLEAATTAVRSGLVDPGSGVWLT